MSHRPCLRNLVASHPGLHANLPAHCIGIDRYVYPCAVLTPSTISPRFGFAYCGLEFLEAGGDFPVSHAQATRTFPRSELPTKHSEPSAFQATQIEHITRRVAKTDSIKSGSTVIRSRQSQTPTRTNSSGNINMTKSTTKEAVPVEEHRKIDHSRKAALVFLNRLLHTTMACGTKWMHAHHSTPTHPINDAKRISCRPPTASPGIVRRT